MHPRNIYRKPPDFKELALVYPDFRKVAKQDLSGKVSIDFKDPEAVRALSKCLLHHDFNLRVDIPPDRLVPTVPLRLNYLLWIEDILKENSLQISEVTGIDIGTGASCIYPLLAASHFKWHMLATEIDEESYKIALKNVEVNNLQDMISVKKVSSDTVLTSALDTGHHYEFCMCNPPFFSSEMELDPKLISRSPSRPLPHNARTGSMSELVSPGGEIGFIKRIIDDSKELKNLVRVYTVMMGHKNSVKIVENFLKEANVHSIGTTEFCQGHTTRWAIAWTYDSQIVLRKVKKEDTKKNNTPYTLPVEQKIEFVVSRIKELLSRIGVKVKILKDSSDFCGMELTAEKNTWAKQRRKRREYRQNVLSKKEDNESFTNSQTSITGLVSTDGLECIESKSDSKMLSTSEMTMENVQHIDVQSKRVSEDITISREHTLSIGMCQEERIPEASVHNKESTSVTTQNNNSQLKRPAEDDGNYDSLKKTKSEMASYFADIKVDPVLVASLVIRPAVSDTSLVEICWLGGVGGKDSAHQLLQYIKNSFENH